MFYRVIRICDIYLLDCSCKEKRKEYLISEKLAEDEAESEAENIALTELERRLCAVTAVIISVKSGKVTTSQKVRNHPDILKS